VLVHLIGGPGYPAEMADEFGADRANLSNHLTCLRECGLVTATVEGRRVRYELADPRLAEGAELSRQRAGRHHQSDGHRGQFDR
jgi:DNA-binding transcriptional ArsR family regulator